MHEIMRIARVDAIRKCVLLESRYRLIMVYRVAINTVKRTQIVSIDSANRLGRTVRWFIRTAIGIDVGWISGRGGRDYRRRRGQGVGNSGRSDGGS
jgi:hypothetical protein